MKIYEVEKRDGFEEILSKPALALELFSHPNAFQAEACILRPNRGSDLKNLLYNTIAGKEDADLERGFSLFVSTGWNKNTDVFLPGEVWKAKSTPSDKPCNYQHDVTKIIGHMTNCMAVDDEYNIIDKESEAFHLVNGYVIYKSLMTHGPDDIKQIVSEVLEGISTGSYYVSMEALFPNFDYALIDKEGQESLIARSEESAFLTKHLLAFGGNGIFKDYRVGRVLRDIVFSGKGFVKNPANPKSIIFRNSFPFNGVESTVATIINQEIPMSAEVDTKLKAELEASQAEVKALKAEVDKHNAKAYEVKLSDLNTELTASKARVTELETAVKASEAKSASIEDLLKKEQAAKADEVKKVTDLTAKLDEIKATERTSKRTAALAKLGYATEKLTETLASLDKLDDAGFDHVVALMTKVEPKVEPTEAEKAAAADKALETVQNVNKPNLNLDTESVDKSKQDELYKGIAAQVSKYRKQPKK